MSVRSFLMSNRFIIELHSANATIVSLGSFSFSQFKRYVIVLLDYKLVEQDDYLLVDGLHERIVSEELWHEAQVKLI